jgi:hypothetical protein
MKIRRNSKTSSLVRVLTTGLIAVAGVLAVGVGPSSAQRPSAQGPFSFPLPAEFDWLGFSPARPDRQPARPQLTVPAGNSQIGILPANGTQDYQCRTTATGFNWAFTGPRANLFDYRAWLPSYRQLTGTHFNLQGTALAGTSADGPRWSLADGSGIRGVVVASAPGRSANDIPHLLLQAFQEGGEGFLSNVSYLTRIGTTGGVAPAAANCNASTVGSVAQVPYTTTYVFYAPTPRPPECDESGFYCPA